MGIKVKPFFLLLLFLALSLTGCNEDFNNGMFTMAADEIKTNNLQTLRIVKMIGQLIGMIILGVTIYRSFIDPPRQEDSSPAGYMLKFMTAMTLAIVLITGVLFGDLSGVENKK